MALLLCAIGAAASWIPARGVVRIDPIVVLQEESVAA
jgi:ABC-type antimicrobial peptide transport system permease subunit